jgi:hypothetical protein
LLGVDNITAAAATVPEPGMISLMAFGFLSLFLVRTRRG